MVGRVGDGLLLMKPKRKKDKLTERKRTQKKAYLKLKQRFVRHLGLSSMLVVEIINKYLEGGSRCCDDSVLRRGGLLGRLRCPIIVVNRTN